MGSFVEFINDCGKMFVGSTGLMLIQSSVLITILFGLDILLRKRIRAVFRYCIWMLVLIKLVLPSNLSMPFSMGYWFSNAYDSVASSLPDDANPPNNPTQIASESSSESTATVLDNPIPQVPASPEYTDALSTPNLLRSIPATEYQATNSNVKANAVKTEPATDKMTVQSTQGVDLESDGIVALTWQGVLFGLWSLVCVTTGLLVLQKTLLIQRLVRQAPPANKRLVELFESWH